MDNFYLTALVREIRPTLVGQTVAAVQVESPHIVFGFGSRKRETLVAFMDRGSPAVFLASRTPLKRHRHASNQTEFGLQLQRHLTGSRILRIDKPDDDRLVQIHFAGGEREFHECELTMVLELKGRNANAFLVGGGGEFIASLYPTKSTGRDQSDADQRCRRKPADFDSSLSPSLRDELLARASGNGIDSARRSLQQDLERTTPTPIVYSRIPLEQIGERDITLKTDLVLSNIQLLHVQDLIENRFDTLSLAAEAYVAALARARALKDELNNARQVTGRKISKCRSILDALQTDKRRFENPERFRRAGELLLANVAQARIEDDSAVVTDYFDPAQRKIRIEITPGATIQQAAADYFKQYQKATRAQASIEARANEIEPELHRLEHLLTTLETEPTRTSLSHIPEQDLKTGTRSTRARLAHVRPAKRSEKKPPRVGWRFESSDGYEILVGRNDRENDAITFRIARSNDLWLHAADYPGSHVIVRNNNRTEIPHRTIIEAAELAAFNSQAKRSPKVAVHYTQKKFVSKPPKAKPGLVRLSSFKTVLVEPRSDLQRLDG